jgi:drug/metabolite transporter (DMT)-like permease
MPADPTVSADDVPAATAVVLPPKAAGGDAGTLGLLLLVSCVVIWGVNAVAFKVAQRPSVGVGLDPVLLNGVRFLLVAPLLVLIVRLRRPDALKVTDRRDLWRYALFGFVSIVLGETLPAAAVRFTSVANMTLLGPGTISLFTALWAVVLREQRLSRSGWVGALVATCGVALVAAAGRGGLRLEGGTALLGDAIALGRSATQGLYLLFLVRTLRERSVLTVSVYNVVFGALLFLPYVLWKAPSVPWARVPPQVWAAVAWSVLPTTVYGFLVWNWAMRRAGAVAATNVMYLQPVFGALAAWLILGEPLRAGQVLGGLVIVGGIVVLRWDAMRGAGFTPRLPWRRSV